MLMASSEITSCAEALRLLAAHLDGELDEDIHTEVERHLETCRSCYSRTEFERQLKASIAELGAEPVPAELSDRVRTLISRFTVSAT
jgi:anti-sigma factor (TIGR02949 family)